MATELDRLMSVFREACERAEWAVNPSSRQPADSREARDWAECAEAAISAYLMASQPDVLASRPSPGSAAPTGSGDAPTTDATEKQNAQTRLLQDLHGEFTRAGTATALRIAGRIDEVL